MSLVPAYGRDYKSKKAVLIDWNDNKDFIIQDMSSPYDGKYANKQDYENDKDSPATVNIRYDGLRKVMVVPIVP